MPRGKREQADQIILKPRDAELEPSRGKTVPDAAKKIGVTEQTYYRWNKKYGGLRMDQAKRLKDLEKEPARPDGPRGGNRSVAAENRTSRPDTSGCGKGEVPRLGLEPRTL